MSKIKNKGKKQKTITFLWGLPGAGKTTYAKKSSLPTIDCDALFEKENKLPSKLQILSRQIQGHLIYANSVIVDSLMTTNLQARKLIDYLVSDLEQYDLVFNIVWWKENREACLINDKSRMLDGRSKNSKLSIKNLPFEKPNILLLPELKQTQIFAMQTVQACPILNIMSEVGYDVRGLARSVLIQDLKLHSSSWSMGGTYGNCWDSELGTIDAEPQPEFHEFDELMEKLCPTITFLQYKKISRECCSIKTVGDGDYYGGYSSRSTHVCDLEKLYHTLKEMNIITE
jgi:hypothetical protein